MYRSVSLGMFGTQKHHFHLRLITALEIINNKLHYDSSSKGYVDHIKDNRIVTGSYQQLVSDAVSIGSYADMYHIFALSAALNRPIQSYYPPLVSSIFHAEPYHRKIIGRGVNASEEPAVTVMWTTTRQPHSFEAFEPNHFVPLVRRQAPQTPQTINLDDTDNNSDGSSTNVTR